jgi:hypothetical protein
MRIRNLEEKQIESGRLSNEALQILIQIQSMGSTDQFRQSLNVTLINIVSLNRKSFTDEDRFYISFLSLREMSIPLINEKFGMDVTNLLIDPSIFILKTMNQNQYFIIQIDRFIQSGDMNIINQLRCSFEAHDQNLREVIQILNPIVSTELFQLFKYLFLDKTLDSKSAVFKMWRGEQGTVDHIMISIIYELQGLMFERFHTMLMELGEVKGYPTLN